MKFIGIFILVWTIFAGFMIALGMKLNKSNEELRKVLKGGAIFIGLICLGLWFIF